MTPTVSGDATRAAPAAAALTEFVRDRRVRFTVSPEAVLGKDGPILVGFDVRLLAWHGHDAHPLQGCPVCAALEAHLADVAAYSVGPAERPAEVEIDPDVAVLYESPDAAGTDEVALDLRLLRRGDDDHAIGEPERAYLRQVRARLKALGARER
jgi:hypothetical protein